MNPAVLLLKQPPGRWENVVRKGARARNGSQPRARLDVCVGRTSAGPEKARGAERIEGERAKAVRAMVCIAEARRKERASSTFKEIAATVYTCDSDRRGEGRTRGEHQDRDENRRRCVAPCPKTPTSTRCHPGRHDAKFTFAPSYLTHLPYESRRERAGMGPHFGLVASTATLLPPA